MENMNIENMTIHGGSQQFSNITGLEQDIIDALKEQAERCAKLTYPSYLQNHSEIRPYPGPPLPLEAHIALNWFSHLTPKGRKIVGTMQDLINNHE